MPSTASKVWTLSQASAWVVFRDISVVELFASPKPESWVGYLSYPSMWTTHEKGKPQDILNALRDGRLIATGRRSSRGAPREEIPAREWEDVVFDVVGPYRRLENGTKDEPWREIFVPRSQVERIWSRVVNPNGRAVYNRSWIRDRYVELKKLHDGFNKDELIEEVQSEYQIAFDGVEPARTTVQRYTKDL